MTYFKQLMILLAAYFAGLVLEYALKLPLPGLVLGLILLFLTLLTGLVKPAQVETASRFLLNHMAFLFIPAGVGLMTTAGSLKGKALPVVLITLITTAVVWLVTALSVKLFRRLIK